MQTKDDFYIGWMPSASAGYLKPVRWLLAGIAVWLVGLALVLGTGQRPFSDAVFEYGQLTEIKGIYLDQPVPLVRIWMPGGVGNAGEVLSIPLVGYGKHGAKGAIRKFEQLQHLRLNNRAVRVRGTLLYGEGKTLLQVDEHDAGYLQLGDSGMPRPPAVLLREWATQSWKGEILDPKCYFGVMKPGRGKPHRDCAIRCLEGGMSAVFRMTDTLGQAHYALLLGANGQSIEPYLKNWVADPVELQASARQMDDWLLLYVNDPASIHRIGGRALFSAANGGISCSPH